MVKFWCRHGHVAYRAVAVFGDDAAKIFRAQVWPLQNVDLEWYLLAFN